ncbi:hypothetical protein E2C01_014358 [Portunus trituberculatus]|uniref:Uncharacterized protein n=1 Tax=Portunus trituberculatus TaxID=210409 RepID=A0A5B7DJN8_PORTR|nr:hypothetical protein [Portunus trituberculatus]
MADAAEAMKEKLLEDQRPAHPTSPHPARHPPPVHPRATLAHHPKLGHASHPCSLRYHTPHCHSPLSPLLSSLLALSPLYSRRCATITTGGKGKCSS